MFSPNHTECRLIIDGVYRSMDFTASVLSCRAARLWEEKKVTILIILVNIEITIIQLLFLRKYDAFIQHFFTV